MQTRINNFMAVAFVVVSLVGGTSYLTMVGAAQSAGFSVIINDGNTFAGEEAEAKQLVKRLYLMDRSDWPGNTPAKPFGRALSSAEHEAFLQNVLEMTQAQLEQHWQSLKQRTGQTPPVEVSSDKMLLKMVQKYEGAVGVMPSAAVDPSVRVLLTF
jgi:hypothetical protein